MDCGPAALKSLLDGFGIPVSYGRLREACQTAVDGTSIDELETLAKTLGLDAEQVMMPVDHVLLPEAKALPALAVARLPGGNRHFLVLWRMKGAWVQVMDPLRGRRWVRRRALARELFVHSLVVEAETFREWALSEGFLAPLRRRLRDLGLPEGGEALLQNALAHPTWQGIAALDAVVRTVSDLVEAKALARGTEAHDLVSSLLLACAEAIAAPENTSASAVPLSAFTARPAPPAADGTSQVWLRGAVLVSIAGASPLDQHQRAALPVALRAALEVADQSPLATLIELLRPEGRWRPRALVTGLLAAAAGTVGETILFRGLLDTAEQSGHATKTLAGAFAAFLAIVIGLLALEWPLMGALHGVGRRLENRMRRAFARKIPLLGDRYFQSRPVSDMAERAHVTHQLRGMPLLGGQLLRTVAQVIVTGVALGWLYPPGALLTAASVLTMLLLPLVAQGPLTERDLRMRSHAGALTRFSLDALLGLTAIRTHGAEASVVAEHDDRLREWLAAGRATLRTALTAEALQAVVGFGLAAWLLAGFLRSGAATATGTSSHGVALLVIYWSLTLPLLGNEIGALVRQYPPQRNVALRLIEPLGAPDEEPSSSQAPRSATTGVRIELSGCEVHASGHTLLSIEELAIAPGEHVAIVGPSGAGKSTLLGLLLGWYEPAAGEVRVNDRAWDADVRASVRRRAVWVDPSVYLWNRSLHENLAFGLAGAPPSLEAAIDEAELGDVIARLPGGRQGALGEAGALVSGGEGQRVRFARGICREAPDLVLLDEPFRGLTHDQRSRLLARARQRWSTATLLCVTHDLSETLAFPRVLVIAEGRLVEDGVPAVLAQQPGTRYAALLEAERRVHSATWSPSSPTAWRRLRMVKGVLEGSTVPPA